MNNEAQNLDMTNVFDQPDFQNNLNPNAGANMIQVNLDGFTKQQISMLLIRDDENKVNGDWVNSKSNYAKVIMLEKMTGTEMHETNWRSYQESLIKLVIELEPNFGLQVYLI